MLPSDFTREVPGHAWRWLLQWGLGAAYWKESLGYSPSKQRLIFRVGDTQLSNGVLKFCGTPLAFSLGRYCPKENEHTSSLSSASMPDAVRNHVLQRQWGASVERSHPPAKWLSYGDCHRHAEVIAGNPEADSTSLVVLVEDLISAHKVAAAGYTVVPLFGTKVAGPVLYYLIQEQRPVALWLDKDQESKVKNDAIRLQGIINQPINVVVTDKDPKALSIDGIKGVL